MRPLPTPPAPGKPVSATLIRQLIDAIRERTILPGRNASVKRGPNGTVLNVDSPAVAAAQSPTELHPWKVFGLKKSDDEVNLFRIYAPGGSILGRKVYVGGDMVSVDGLSLREVEGENDDYWSFDGEGDISDEESTLYIVIYLTPDTDASSGSSDEDEPQDFKFAAEMVLDPEEFKQETKVKAVYAIVPVATVRVETDDEGNEKGVVCSQRLKTDALYVTEYYL